MQKLFYKTIFCIEKSVQKCML